MADRTNPAGEKWKKGRKKKRPLPGTPAQALNEAAGVKTAGTGGGIRQRPCRGFLGKTERDTSVSAFRKRTGVGKPPASGKNKPREPVPPRHRWNRRKHAPCGKKKCPWKMEQRRGHDELSMPESLRDREKRQAGKPPAMKNRAAETRATAPCGPSRPSRGDALVGTDMP